MSTARFSSDVRPWHIANTTVRNPLRLKVGLQALMAQGFDGDMSRDRENSIAYALNRAGVITLSEKTKDVSSIARKWRSALVKLGFVWPGPESIKTHARTASLDTSTLGAAYSLTDNGQRLLTARSLRAEQEVFLRSLACLWLPSPLESNYMCRPFCPLAHVINIIDVMNSRGLEPYISRLEMASIVIRTSSDDALDLIVDEIARQRSNRDAAVNKRRFDHDLITKVSRFLGKKAGTLYDYQDVSFRYLKATGLFQSRGRGIMLVPETSDTADLVAQSVDVYGGDSDYLSQLAQGASLPTDSYDGAIRVLNNLMSFAKQLAIEFNVDSYDLTSVQDVSLARHDLEQKIADCKEIQYAAEQRSRIPEIMAYLEMLDTNKSTVEFDGEELYIPKSERPAYFEWLLWRVLLALEGLVVPPNRVRRFNIDQDFLPVGTAAGGGADVIGEYSDSVLVVEVTLTENSRQEAAEGEPVRRHVAEVLEAFDGVKPVYGLFVARRIDTNTAETFRIGVWYKKNDERVQLDVVPLTLGQLRRLLQRGVDEGRLDVSVLTDVIQAASTARATSNGAPDWKTTIGSIVGV